LFANTFLKNAGVPDNGAVRSPATISPAVVAYNPATIFAGGNRKEPETTKNEANEQTNAKFLDHAANIGLPKLT
jgi:hypothetical protein